MKKYLYIFHGPNGFGYGLSDTIDEYVLRDCDRGTTNIVNLTDQTYYSKGQWFPVEILAES